MERSRILITGGAGYIGTELSRMALERGHTVTVADIIRPTLTGHERLHYIEYDLVKPAPAELFEAIDTVIHLAADTSSGAGRIPESVEISMGIALFEAARSRGCRFIFASSQSAREDAPAPYGRIKWHIEQAVLEGGGIVVRPGLVYGGKRDAGVFAALTGLARRLPLLPDIRPRPIVQPIYMGDLCEAFLRLANGTETRPGAYNLGDPRGISFTGFLKSITRYRLRKTRCFLPVPLALFVGLTRLQKLLPRLPDIGSERILGLAALKMMPAEESVRLLELELTPLPLGMVRDRDGIRQLLAHEGRSVLRYVMSGRPSPGLVKRYVSGVEARFGGMPLDIPPLFLRFPHLLYLVDNNTRVLERFGWREVTPRLALAVALAEANPSGAHQFLQLSPRSRAMAWMSLMGIALREAFVKIVQGAFSLAARIMPRSGARS